MMKKRILAAALLVLLATVLSGCDDHKPVQPDTPLAEAYNAVWEAKRNIAGFDEKCIRYDAGTDSLSLYACPKLDAEALVCVVEAAIAGRAVNQVRICSRTADAAYSEALLEPFSRLFTADIALLELDKPEMMDGGVAQPELWRACLARMHNVAELMLPSVKADAEYPSYAYLYGITGGEAMFPQYKRVTVYLTSGLNDLSGMECFSGMERLSLTAFSGSSRVEAKADVLSAAPSLRTVDIVYGVGTTTMAMLAYELRDRGFAVEGISDDPRDDLKTNTAQRDYEKYLARRQAEAVLAAGDGSFDERFGSLNELMAAGWTDGLAQNALDFLAYFYSLAQTPEFPEYVAKLTYKEKAAGNSKYDLMLSHAASRVENCAQRLADALPQGGGWCREILDADSVGKDKSVLDVLMEPFLMLTGEKYFDGGERKLLKDAIYDKNLITGALLVRYLDRGADDVFALVKRSMQSGTISSEAAYNALLNTAISDKAYVVNAPDSLDGTLHAVTLWEREFDAPTRINYALDGWELGYDNSDFANASYVPDPAAAGMAAGRTALFAYKTEDAPGLTFTATAYMQLGDDDGNTYRAIPKAYTPQSIEAAELIIIAYRTYAHAFDYTDGTEGYRCVCDVYAYNIATGECIQYLGKVSNDPPSKARVERHATRVNASVPTKALCALASHWLNGESGGE